MTKQRSIRKMMIPIFGFHYENTYFVKLLLVKNDFCLTDFFSNKERRNMVNLNYIWYGEFLLDWYLIMLRLRQNINHKCALILNFYHFYCHPYFIQTKRKYREANILAKQCFRCYNIFSITRLWILRNQNKTNFYFECHNIG